MQQGVEGKVFCGLFGVEKAGKGCLRVIYDARLANRELEPREEQLLLFTLHELIDSFRQYRYVHTVDYRHYYYSQFRMPFGLAVWFVSDCRRDADGSRRCCRWASARRW